jgi:coproporphyrinogen III oxidase-like Fe-S oxidoreductase
MRQTSPEKEKLSVYDSRENWPPYTYRDYPSITPEVYSSFLEFLSTENTSGKVMELQPWISFCDSRCTFCYYPTAPYSQTKIEPYLLALKKELKMYAETKYVQTSLFDEIVLGGGTPSLLTAEQMIDLIGFCEKNFNTAEGYFIKVTGSSRSFDEKKLETIAKYGVYQVDMGAQTFDNKIRKTLNLPDSAENVENEIKAARKLGLCVCIDLMYNLPGQTMESWINSINKAIELDVEVDSYSLEICPGTALEKEVKEGKVPPLGDANTEREMYLAAYDLFTKAGYKAVGHDRFSRVEWHLKENCLNGWPWAGILTTGAGCFMGYLQRYSYSNIDDTQKYMEAVQSGRFPLGKLSKSTDTDMMRKVMTRLYLRLPVDKQEFRHKFGKLPEEVFPKQINKLKTMGLIESDDKEIRITKQGDIWKGNIAWEFASNKQAR